MTYPSREVVGPSEYVVHISDDLTLDPDAAIQYADAIWLQAAGAYLADDHDSRLEFMREAEEIRRAALEPDRCNRPGCDRLAPDHDVLCLMCRADADEVA